MLPHCFERDLEHMLNAMFVFNYQFSRGIGTDMLCALTLNDEFKSTISELSSANHFFVK